MSDVARDRRQTVAHPVIWTVLYLPFGATSGFVSVALPFVANQHGLSITKAAFLPAANLLISWLKWLWAPIVDVTLSPRWWYVISTLGIALGVVVTCAIPMTQDNLLPLVVVVAATSVMRSIVGMAIEAMLAAVTTASDRGRASAWFQVGNVGASGLGGGLGLTLMQHFDAPWLAGGVLAAIYAACTFALRGVPAVAAHRATRGAWAAVRRVAGDVARLARTRRGIAVATLCFLPFGTGAALSVLAQADVAKRWGADAGDVALVQGYVASIVTAAGCFAGGWVCSRMRPVPAYVAMVATAGAAALVLGVAPLSVTTYVVGVLAYTFVNGAVFVGFTACVLDAMGVDAAATKYNLYASLSNFPTWWLGIALAVVADHYSARSALVVEAAAAGGALVIYAAVRIAVRRSSLPDALPDALAENVDSELAASATN